MREAVREGCLQRMKPKEDLRQAALHIPWTLVATVFMLVGASQLAISQESIDFQDRNKALDAGVLSLINAEPTARGLGAISGDEVLQTAAQWMAEEGQPGRVPSRRPHILHE